MPEQLKLYLLPLLALIGFGVFLLLRPAPGESGGAVADTEKVTAALVTPEVRALDPKVEGMVSKPAVIRLVGEKQKELENCYGDALRRTQGAAGRLIMQISIDGEGKVASVLTAASQVADDKVGPCFAEVLSPIEFPADGTGQTTSVSYPFMLAPKVEASVELNAPRNPS